MEDQIVGLLADRDPKQAQDFILAFGEHRTASWADSQRQAALKAASKRHVPHFRGQLRHQLGETALANAAQVAKVGCIPFPTVKPGGVFMVARVGRFGLVSLRVGSRRALPRRSPTRLLLSNPNDDIDPQQKLWAAEKASARGATELAYFGCMVVQPSRNDPSAPAEMALAIPNARMTDWLDWIPLPRVFAALQNIVSGDGSAKEAPQIRPIPDRRMPTFRLPKRNGEADEGGSSS